MNSATRIKNWKIHNSMRGLFSYELYKHMQFNSDIYLLLGDLGFNIFEPHLKDFPTRSMSVGASEQAMLDMAVGIAYSGKIPVCYSITPFLLYRPFETIRTYINHEKLNIKLVGSGRDRDYAHDGYSHNAEDDMELIRHFDNMVRWSPMDSDMMPRAVKMMLKNGRPTYLNLTR